MHTYNIPIHTNPFIFNVLYLRAYDRGYLHKFPIKAQIPLPTLALPFTGSFCDVTQTRVRFASSLE